MWVLHGAARLRSHRRVREGCAAGWSHGRCVGGPIGSSRALRGAAPAAGASNVLKHDAGTDFHMPALVPADRSIRVYSTV